MDVLVKSFLVFLSFLTLTGCQPEGIIPPKDMTSLVAAFYQADATIDELQEGGHGRMNFDSLRVYRPILEARGYTDEDFRTSLDYYLHEPKTLEKIFTQARDELLKMADRQPGEDWVDEEDRDEPVLHEGVEKEDLEMEAEKRREEVLDEAEQEEKALESKVKKQRRQRKKMSRQDLKELEKELK
jgi:hypothetical protein